MALIKCYECEKEISDKAPACPHCGAPKHQQEASVEQPVPTVEEKSLEQIPMGEALEGEVELKDEHVEALENIKADIAKLFWRSIEFLKNEPKKGDLGGQAADFFNNSVNYFSFYHIAIQKRYDKAEEQFNTQYKAFKSEKLNQYENAIKSMDVNEIERFDSSFLEKCADELSRMSVEIKKSNKIPDRASRKTW